MVRLTHFAFVLGAACLPARANAGTPKTIAAVAPPGPGQPLAPLVAGSDGAYYGVEFGTISLTGPGVPFPSVFRLAPAPGAGWTVNVPPVALPLASGAQLVLPMANLVAAPAGVLVGTATLNGCNVLGSGFTCPCDVIASYQKKTLCSFTGGQDGGGPDGGLVAGRTGQLLGVTYYGGVDGYGTVYRLPVTVP